MNPKTLAAREAVKPLGIHTAVGHLHELKRWKDIPHLCDNDGMLPPFIIAVGSRVRVLKAAQTIGMRDSFLLDQEALLKAGADAYGRVAILAGIAKRKGVEFPLAVVETQMGCPATQINLREILYFSRDDGYIFGGREMRTDGIYVVRAGTCAGVNSRSPSELALSIGDIAIATETYGSVGAVIQSALRELDFVGSNLRAIADKMRKLLAADKALAISHDSRNLVSRPSQRIVLHLQDACDSLGLANFAGPNFTKDSLYAEMGEDEFARLRDNYGIISTEMEQLAIDVLGAEFRKAGVPVFTGLASAVVGAIPGKSFPETPEEKKNARDAEAGVMEASADAFAEIVKKLNS